MYRITAERQSIWLLAGNVSVEPLNCDSVGAILVRGLHLHYYSLWRPTSRNQEPHRGTWFNMKPRRAVLLYNEGHRNKASSMFGDSK